MKKKRKKTKNNRISIHGFYKRKIKKEIVIEEKGRNEHLKVKSLNFFIYKRYYFKKKERMNNNKIQIKENLIKRSR